MYDLDYRKPPGLVPRRRRIGVPGRITVDGEVAEPLDEAAVRAAATELVDDHGVESIAICFLHSYRNDAHERRAAEVVRSARPGVSVSVSAAVAPEYREYERTSTAVLDGYIKPVFGTYLDRLETTLADAGFEGSFSITRSGGGTLSAARARETPVQTVLSGPAGGIIGASAVGDLTERPDLITVDIGGTSTDACVVRDGSPAVQYESTLDHVPLQIPVYDIRTIGAGGGSIARLDAGLLKVGPESAGADPGPICYGRGGERPTVTDAALALGYVDPAGLLGGELPLARDAAVEGIEATLADPLDSTVTEAAAGVLEVTAAKAVGAIREITVERGLDPREFTLVAFGGAGPLLGPLFARELGVDEVLIPRAPSVFSAWGMLLADVVHDVSAVRIATVDELDGAELDDAFADLDAEAREALAADGFDRAATRLSRSVEMRYVGQEHTVEVDADGVGSVSELGDRFEALHAERYGHTMDDTPEVVGLRVRGTGVTEGPSFERETGGGAAPTRRDTREAYCAAAERPVDAAVYDRADLSPDHAVAGPAVVEQPTTTTVIHSDQSARLDAFGNVVVTGGAAQ
jgi:N-methylhydantoinase A